MSGCREHNLSFSPFFLYILILSHQSSFCTRLQQLRVFNEIFKLSPPTIFKDFVITCATFLFHLSPSVPKVQFREAVYSGEESDGQITAIVFRSGDIRHRSTVRCYSRQGSAEVASDFDERPNTDASVITFLPGEL